MSVIQFGADWRAGPERAILAGMPYEYRVTEAADGTFPWSCGARKAGASSSFIKRADFRLGSWRRPGLFRWRFNLLTLLILLNPARV